MSPLSTLKNHIDKLAPGVICAAVVAIAAMFLSEHYGASAMLFALLLGMALNFLGQEGKCVAGIQFAASMVLQIGVALLGLRITFGEITALGPNTALMVIAGVVLTILFGWLFRRLAQTVTGRRRRHIKIRAGAGNRGDRHAHFAEGTDRARYKAGNADGRRDGVSRRHNCDHVEDVRDLTATTGIPA